MVAGHVIVPLRRRALAGYSEGRFQERHGGSLESVSVQVNGG